MRAVSASALLLVLLGGAAPAPLAAQRQELTVFAGGNFSSVSGGSVDNSKARAGFQVGLSLRLPRSAMLSFQPELLVVQRHFFAARAASTLPARDVGPRSDAPDLLYGQLPLLMRIQKGYSTERSVRPFLVLGPYVGVRLSCKRELIEASGGVSHPDCSFAPPSDRPASTDPFFPAVFEEFDVGFIGELGVEIRRLAVGLRGERSLRNLVAPGALPTSPLEQGKIWSASLSVEYLLRVL
jgi:hypothetical protein